MFRAIFAILAFAATSFAQEQAPPLPVPPAAEAPAVGVTFPTAEVKASVGRLVKLTAAAPAGRSIKWLLADNRADLIAFPDGRMAIFASPVVGRFRVWAYTASADGWPSDPAVMTVTITDPNPKPKPGPSPVTPVTPPVTPVTPPAPVKARRIKLLVIEETAQAANDRAAYWQDPDWLKTLGAGGHPRPLVVDQNVKNAAGQVPASLKPYLDAAADKTLPYAFLIDDETKKLITDGVLPEKPANLVEWFKKNGG